MEQVAAAIFETEIATLSPSREMGMADDGEGIGMAVEGEETLFFLPHLQKKNGEIDQEVAAGAVN